MRLAFLNPQGNFDAANSYLASHPDFGGQLVYVREVARTLDAMGHHADILTRRFTDPDWPPFAGETDAYPGFPNARILRVPCGPDRFLPKEELWPHLAEWAAGVARLYREEGSWPDLWTGHYADGGLAAALLEEVSGVPFVFAGHSLGAWKLDSLLRDVGEEALGELDARYNFGARIGAERAAISRASAVVTNSAAERDEQYGHPAYRGLAGTDRFAVVPPGVNHEIFAPDARSPWEDEVLQNIHAAHERDIASERRELPAVIAWSRLDPKKNHRALVRAFVRHEGLRGRANLVMITRGLDDPLRDASQASGEQRTVLQELTSEMDQAELWGAVSAFSLSGQTALAALYRWGAGTGGVFCLPAEYEPFGMTVVEAMAVGLPVVATRNGGPQETTDGGRSGLLADPHDPDDLAEKLFHLVSDPEAWQTYAARGRERALEHYSWRSTAGCYLHLAEEALSGECGGEANEPSFPLPDFVRRDVSPPRLRTWTTSGGRTLVPTPPTERIT